MSNKIEDLVCIAKWEAEAALSGFGTMSQNEAVASARYSFNRILDAIEQLDVADRVRFGLEEPGWNEGAGQNLHVFKAINSKAPCAPASNGPAVRHNNHCVQCCNALSEIDRIRFKKDFAFPESSDNVLSFFDGFTDRLLR